MDACIRLTRSDPVLAIVEDGWLKADRTTLGADDGAGVAAILALLEDKDLKVGQVRHPSFHSSYIITSHSIISSQHPHLYQLEGLFTAEEETTMAGAENLEPAPFLTGNVMINVDSEEPHSVCVGCAGGFEKLVRVPVKRVAATSQQVVQFPSPSTSTPRTTHVRRSHIASSCTD